MVREGEADAVSGALVEGKRTLRSCNEWTVWWVVNEVSLDMSVIRHQRGALGSVMMRDGYLSSADDLTVKPRCRGRGGPRAVALTPAMHLPGIGV
jgi:hypothetical protein